MEVACGHSYSLFYFKPLPWPLSRKWYAHGPHMLFKFPPEGQECRVGGGDTAVIQDNCVFLRNWVMSRCDTTQGKGMSWQGYVMMSIPFAYRYRTSLNPLKLHCVFAYFLAETNRTMCIIKWSPCSIKIHKNKNQQIIRSSHEEERVRERAWERGKERGRKMERERERERDVFHAKWEGQLQTQH